MHRPSKPFLQSTLSPPSTSTSQFHFLSDDSSPKAMSLGILPAFIRQATPTGNDGESWASLFSTYMIPSIIPGEGDSSCQKRFSPLFDESGKQYDDTIISNDLRPSLRNPAQIVVEISNWLSLVGSLIIVLHAPKVVKQVPSQRTRMLIIVFIAVSNFGFALANIWTDLTDATTFLPCSVSAWCYCFFQLLTCLLIIVSTFRLCGVFLFKQQISFPTKAVVLCPLIAFVLATSPAAAHQFDFDICGHYCWFVLRETVDCRVRSLWAWFCFYIPMIIFLVIIFASTSFVMIKIAFTVINSRSDLNKVVNAGRDETISSPGPAASPQPASVSTFDRLRTMSQALTARTASIFSHLSSKPEAPSHTTAQGTHCDSNINNSNSNSNNNNNNNNSSSSNSSNDGIPVSDIRIELTQAEPDVLLSAPSAAHINRMASLGLDSPTLRSEGILSSPIENISATRIAMPDQTQPPETARTHSPVQLLSPHGNCDNNVPAAVLRANERPFLLAILRQALYPISISVSGSIQTVVDLTLGSESGNADALDYAANIGTSIQGFLFFLVFLFDPAVVQTRENFRKYLVWKYYVEFYYSLGMPQEGRAFEDAFHQKCRETLNKPKNVYLFDLLTRPPPYSWSVQYDDLAMPSDFQTSYPLSRARGSTGRASTAAAGRGESGTGVGRLSLPYGPSRSTSASKPLDPPATIIEDDETHSSSTASPNLNHSEPPGAQSQDSSKFMSRAPITKTNARPTDYTHLQSIPHPLSNEPVLDPSPTASVVSFSDPRNHPISTNITVPSDIEEGEVAEVDTSLTPTSPDLSLIQAGGRVTWPQSYTPGLNMSISFSSTDSVDIVDDFGISRTLDHDHDHRYSLKAPYARDVLSSQKLDRVTTIGGSDIRSPHLVYRPSMVSSSSRRKTRATMGDSPKSSSIGHMFHLPSPLRLLSFGSFSSKSQSREAGGEQDQECQQQQQQEPERSMSDQYRYQCRFHYPRLAYRIHQMVRLLYVPREARLPPIPNPFSTAGRVYPSEETASRTPSVPQPLNDEDVWLSM